MGYLVIFGILWAVLAAGILFMRESIPTTVKPENGEALWLVLWAGVGAVMLTIFIAGVVEIGQAF